MYLRDLFVHNAGKHRMIFTGWTSAHTSFRVYAILLEETFFTIDESQLFLLPPGTCQIWKASISSLPFDFYPVSNDNKQKDKAVMISVCSGPIWHGDSLVMFSTGPPLDSTDEVKRYAKRNMLYCMWSANWRDCLSNNRHGKSLWIFPTSFTICSRYMIHYVEPNVIILISVFPPLELITRTNNHPNTVNSQSY